MLANLALVSARSMGGRVSRAEGVGAPEAVKGRLPLYVLLPAMDWAEGEDAERFIMRSARGKDVNTDIAAKICLKQVRLPVSKRLRRKPLTG